jgi:hypothetical protein
MSAPVAQYPFLHLPHRIHAVQSHRLDVCANASTACGLPAGHSVLMVCAGGDPRMGLLRLHRLALSDSSGTWNSRQGLQLSAAAWTSIFRHRTRQTDIRCAGRGRTDADTGGDRARLASSALQKTPLMPSTRTPVQRRSRIISQYQ